MGVEEEHGEGALALRSRLWSRSLREQPPPPPIQQSQVSWDVSSYQPVIPSSLHSPFPNDPSRINDKRDDINGRRVYGDPESQLLAKFNLNGGRTRSFELPPSSYPVELDNQYESPGRDGKRPSRRTQSTSELSWWSARKRQRVIASNDLIVRAKSTVPAAATTTTSIAVVTTAATTPKRNGLKRFATSPAVLNSQRLLTLANQISRGSSRVTSANASREGTFDSVAGIGDPDTAEDDPPVTDMSDGGYQVPSLVMLVPPTPRPVSRPGQALNPNELFPEIHGTASASGNDHTIVSSEDKASGNNFQDKNKDSGSIDDSLDNIEDFFFNSDSDDEILRFLEEVETENEHKNNTNDISSIRLVFMTGFLFIFYFEYNVNKNSDKPVAPEHRTASVYRFTVSEVHEKKNESMVIQVDLKVRNANNQQFLLVLMGNWIYCTPPVGATINYIGTFDPVNNNMAVIDNEKRNMIVVEPGTMVSCTNIADSLYCERKVVLRSRLRSAGDTTTAIVYGSIIHEIFQSCLAKNQFKRRFIRPKITALVQEWSEELLLAGVTAEIASEHLESKVSKLCQWGNNFLRSNPLVKVTETRSQTQKLVSIGKIIDIEEELWSATYGIRGFVDATVETCIRTSRDDTDIKRFLVPLEIKTSVNPKSTFTHQAQTTLYTLLLSERYEIDIDFGLLVYSDNATTIIVPTIQREVMDLIIKRNQIAMSLNKKDSLPPMIDNERQCRLCEYLDYCVVYKCVENNATISRKAVEKMGPAAGILRDYVDLVGKVKKKHIDFFKHWHTVLDKEEQGMENHMKELWEMTSATREKVGRCFSSVQTKELMSQNISTDTTAHYTYKLAPYESRKFDLKSSELHSGDRIVVSDENGHIFLASGVLLEVSESYLIVKVKKRLPDILQKQLGFDINSNQSYNSLLHSYWDQENFEAPADATPQLFRVDKNEFAFNLNIARNNLVELLLNRLGSNRLLNVIVDLKPPVFNKMLRHPELESISLNADQQAALNKVASGMDYTIVSGMHGTGKSHTIAAIVEYLVTQKHKTVLVTANTHRDVDDLVVKMGGRGFGVLRIGGWSADPAVLAHMPVSAKIHNEADVHAVYMEPPVVATTCLGITHWVFTRRLRFDYCIIDEASQVSLPTALGPVCFAEKFILVGDDSDFHGIKSTDNVGPVSALKENISLMERLSVHESLATVRLDTQYRMCDDITELANRVFYNGALRCGSPEIAGRVLGISAENLSSETEWIRRVLANQ